MANVGYATLQIIPSVRGIGDELRRQLVGPAGDAGDAAGDAAGGGFADTFKGALAAIGVAAIAEQLGAQFTDAFAQALEQSSVTKVLAGQLGSTGQTAARQGEAVGRLFSKGVTENFEQGAEAVREVVRAGLVPPGATVKQLELIGGTMTDVARTFGTDMNLQGQAVAAMLKNRVAPDATTALDVITSGLQKLGPNADDLLETFQEYSVQLRKLGIDSEQALGLFRQGIQGGARDTDIIADGFKEFSIRAIDMSTSSIDAYKLLGLNAEKMSLQIAKGGTHANDGLQLVLDRLRAIKDPVKQNAAAVGLFGTQAEDMGAALFKLDPGKAVAGFGDVTGAAKRLGETLHSGPGHELKVFTRTVKQGLVDFVGGQVLPVLTQWGRVFTGYVLPPLSLVGSVLGAVLMPVLTGFGTVVAATVGWVREWGAWLIPLGVAVGGLTLILSANAIATGAVTAVFAVYRGAIIAASAVTRAYTVVQGLFNAVMAANPIALIAVGIAAFVALLVVAYQKSDTFRAIVQAAWSGIKAGWDILWTNALKPGFDGLMIGLQAIGAAASWLWSTILAPVFSAIGLGARILFAIVATVLITPFVIAFKIIGAIATWLWGTVLSPVFSAIGAGAAWLWSSMIKPAFDNVMLIIRGVGAVASWLWSSVFSPVFGWIGDKAASLWSSWIKPAFDSFKLGLQILGDKGRWLWDTVISPVFSWIGDKASWLYDKAIKPAFDNVKKAVSLVGDAFKLAKDAIGRAWDQVSGIAKKPVNFIIEWVYTKGIKAVWDKVAGFVGLGKLPAAPKMLASGGTVGSGWGPAVPMKVNRPTAIVGEGNPRHPEFVIPTDPKYRSRALALHAAAGTRLMEDGGILGGVGNWLAGAAKSVGGFVMDAADFLSDPGAMWEKATGFIRDKVKEIGASTWAQTLARVPGKMLGGLKDKILGAATSFFGGGDSGGGGSWARPVSGALGTRYGVRGNMWSSGYHTGSDFPAPTGTAVRAAANGIVASVLSGGPYGNHISIRHGDMSSMYAHLSSMAVRTGQRVMKGARIGAVGSTGNTTGPHLHFEARKGGRTINPEPLLGYAGGGWPGAGEIAWVGEAGPELVRFGPGGGRVLDHRTSLAASTASVAAVAARAAAAAVSSTVPAPAGSVGAATAGGIAAGQRIRLVVEGREFEAYVEDIADQRTDRALKRVRDRRRAGTRGN